MLTHKLKEIKVLQTLWEQTKGLIGEKEPREVGAGVALPGVNSIHTFFVPYPIDVVFLDKENQVIEAVTLKPFRISPILFSAKTTLELKQGSIKELKIKRGDKIEY